MTIQVETAPEFDKEIERLGRKYPAVFDAVDGLIAQLEGNVLPGNKISMAGAVLYKARLPNRSARRGKRGGFRVIYYGQSSQRIILITIYSKTEKSNIRDDDIRRIIARFN